VSRPVVAGTPQKLLGPPARVVFPILVRQFGGGDRRLSGPSDWPEVQWKNTSAVIASKQASWDRNHEVEVLPSTRVP
jgi:hypothetical protein